VAKTIAAAETPEGVPWAPRRKGGGQVYVNAAGKLRTAAMGNYVRMTLEGVDVYGHFGRTDKQVARPMLPDAGAGMPESVSRALDEAARLAVEDVK
jgi:hypothetical protein